MRKGDLVAAIAARQNGAGAAAPIKARPAQCAGREVADRRERCGATADRRRNAGTNGHSGEPQLPLGDLAARPSRGRRAGPCASARARPAA